MILALATTTAAALVGMAPSARMASRVSSPTMVAGAAYYTSNLPPALQQTEVSDEADLEHNAEYVGLVTSDQTAPEIVWDLVQGNQRYIKERTNPTRVGAAENLSVVQSLVADALNPRPVKALVVSCARSYAPVDTIFDAQPGDLQHLRVCGNCVGVNDGAVGSIEFALARSFPKLLLVMTNSKNDVIEEAVRMAMAEAGRTDIPSSTITLRPDVTESDLSLLKPVVLSAKDALSAMPSAPLEELMEETAKLNAYKSIENLLSCSRIAVKRVLAGELTIEAAYFDVNTGIVSMQGPHPSEATLVKSIPSSGAVRTASDPPVPFDEAKAALYSGNRRYSTGNGGAVASLDDNLMRQLDTAGQNPVSIILGCADSRAPIEILFDVRPGDLFVLRNAGNSATSTKGSIIGSAEYAIGVLKTKLLCVTGHTKCGALTAAVNTVNAGQDTDSAAGSIGIVLEDIIQSARDAIALLPDAEPPEQIALAIKLNIIATMEKLVKHSKFVSDGIEKGDLGLCGAYYDIYTGEVEWMGDHPELEKVMGKELPYWQWKQAKYVRDTSVNAASSTNPKVEQALQKLKRGNERFMNGAMTLNLGVVEVANPMAIVIGGGEVRVPIEKMFDVQPGELVVQRVMGNIAGRYGGTLVASIEFAVARYDPKLLVVLGDSSSRIVKTALEQTMGAQMPSPALRYVVDRVMVSAIRAKTQVDKDDALTAAGRDIQIQRLTVELNVLYTMEQLLRSPIIRRAVRDGFEMHGGILNAKTGNVEFIGQHPALEAYMDESLYE